jgi:hypothetical protein
MAFLELFRKPADNQRLPAAGRADQENETITAPERLASQWINILLIFTEFEWTDLHHFSVPST